MTNYYGRPCKYFRCYLSVDTLDNISEKCTHFFKIVIKLLSIKINFVFILAFQLKIKNKQETKCIFPLLYFQACQNGSGYFCEG